MSGERTWAAAQQAANRLSSADRSILRLLVHMPFLWAAGLAVLLGERGGSYRYRRLAQLQEQGLVATMHSPLGAGHTARLWYLTDLGLATLGCVLGIEPVVLARQARVRRCDLLARVLWLPPLLASYALVVRLAAGHPGRPVLLDWQERWRRRPGSRLTATPPVACVRLGWPEAGASLSCLLIADQGRLPLRAYLRVLRQLPDACPALVVATPDAWRAVAWQRLLAETNRNRRGRGLAMHIVINTEHGESTSSSAILGATQPASPDRPSAHVPAPALRSHNPHRPVPRIVGDLPATGMEPAPPAGESLARLALNLTGRDRRVLEPLGRHPFLSVADLIVLLDRSRRWVLHRLRRLVALGLLRRLAPEEAGRAGTAGVDAPVELTVAGLTLVAAWQGLTLDAGVCELGLAGGGPQTPVGTRRMLLQHLAHTQEADEIMLSLYRTARAMRRSDWEDAVIIWRPAAACCRWPVRPDAYGVYRHRGYDYGFFLEYDRGTMRHRDLCVKFAAYYAYRDSRRFARDYDGFPAILVVTTTRVAEERILRAVRTVSAGRSAPLPVFVTCAWQVLADSRNPDGLLGSIWRTAGSGEQRCTWFASDHAGPADRRTALRWWEPQIGQG